jgi:hypothetical protein
MTNNINNRSNKNSIHQEVREKGHPSDKDFLDQKTTQSYRSHAPDRKEVFSSKKSDTESKKRSLDRKTTQSYQSHAPDRKEPFSSKKSDTESEKRSSDRKTTQSYRSHTPDRKEPFSSKKSDTESKKRSLDRKTTQSYQSHAPDRKEPFSSKKSDPIQTESKKRSFEQDDSIDTLRPSAKKTDKKPFIGSFTNVQTRAVPVTVIPQIPQEQKSKPNVVPAKNISGFNLLNLSFNDDSSDHLNDSFDLSSVKADDSYLLELSETDKYNNPQDLNVNFFEMRQGIPLLKQGDKEFTINGRGRKINHYASGTFHDVFFIQDEPGILLRTVGPCQKWSNSGRAVTVTYNHRKYTLVKRHYVLYQGFESYKALRALAFRVPKIMNEDTLFQDGYYLIEEIPYKASTEAWSRSPKTFKELSRNAQEQLKQAKACLERMRNANELLVPDFKPHNVGFTKKNELVILDFCEDRDIPAFQQPLKKLLEEYAESWAEGNPNIKDYLLN